MFDGLPKISKPSDNDFFKLKNISRESFLINGTEVDSIDVKPEKQKDEIPVLVAPGHGATIESFKPGIEILAKKGRRVISLSHPRRGGNIPDSYNNEIEKWYKKRGQKYPNWPSEELRKAHTILGLLDQKKLDKIDVIAHSEAAINVCIAAMLHPEKFIGRSIVLYSPAGLIGKDTLPRLIKGGITHPKRPDSISKIPVTEAETEYLKSTAHIGADYFKANYLRTFKEVLAISQAQIEDMLRYLHEKGVRIIVIQAVDDTFFPMKKMQKNVKSVNVENGFVDGFLSVRGGHMQIQIHPELYMSAAENMLTKSNEKHAST